MINNTSKLVNTIKVFLESIDMDVPFIVAGGSVFSTHFKINDNYSDIDVYFYKMEDYERVYRAIKKRDAEDNRYNDSLLFPMSRILSNSDLALTVEGPRREIIQFIKVVAGEPEELFKTFDLNCSKIAITSDHILTIDKSCSINIEVDFNNFSDATPSRYLKYTERKGAKDKHNVVAHQIIDHLVNNVDISVKCYYVEDVQRHLRDVLMEFNTGSNNEFNQYIHDKLCAKYSDAELLDLFIYMYESLLAVKDASDEYIASRVYVEREGKNYFGHHNETLFEEEKINNVIMKYPEYFI